MSKNEDYGEEEYDPESVINELMDQNEKLRAAHAQTSNSLAYSSGARGTDPNLAQYQVDSSELLEKLERFYKGEYLAYDKKGKPYWKSPEEEDQKPFNSYGVSAMMEIITKYIDRNTTLSYYSEKRIYEIMADLGDELILYILANYEKLGMDTYHKKTKYRMVVLTTLHMIESTYRRALHGKTIEEINQSKIITQSDSLRSPLIQNAPQKRRGFFSRFI